MTTPPTDPDSAPFGQKKTPDASPIKSGGALSGGYAGILALARMGSLTEIRRLRNRVFHHERIVHMAQLKDIHGRVLETIGWISPELLHVALLVDEFDAVWSQPAHARRGGIEGLISGGGGR